MSAKQNSAKGAALRCPSVSRWSVDLESWPPTQRPPRFGQLEAVDVKRLKALELENNRLKKLLAEAALDIEVLKEINAKKW